MQRYLIMLFVLCISGSVRAEPTPPLPPPYAVPLFDGDQHRDIKPPQGALYRPEKPSPRGLFDTVLSCYPARSWFRLELSLEARAFRENAASTATVATYDVATGTLHQAANNSIGLVARIPLYSADELDRERVQELKRREDAATAVGDFGLALTSYANNSRHLVLYRSLERRAQERVALGVAMTQEQVDLLKAVGDYETALATDLAKMIKSRLVLVSYCETGEKADALDDYLGGLMAGANGGKS